MAYQTVFMLGNALGCFCAPSHPAFIFIIVVIIIVLAF
jgi:hypothetical protein